MVRSPKVVRTAAALALAAGCLSMETGCVIRRYTIRSDPPGAQVIVNDEEIGPTPVSKSFVFYGDREITLIKDGFETKTVVQPVAAPWWDNLLTEFFSENVVPFTLRDEREFTYDLQPARSPGANDVLERAESLRAEAQAPPKPRRRGILAWLGFD
ncbi:PEGA domain-containing protein [Paludisphaera rhizosphaerae]|uniref:PEGA domain-containing protein n=1 Tax=Paludisphaera rhizosphaerae TaxID=2711216 RepID=UPI0013EE3166|nr:PEGA domain-containing protein [Paludisphaera rhizosphaerae]